MKSLAAITLCHLGLAVGRPAPAHVVARTATVTVQPSLAAGGNTAVNSMSIPSVSFNNATQTSFLSTATDAQNGEVVGCTMLVTATSAFTAAGTTYTPGGVYCDGGPVISTAAQAINTSVSGAYTPGVTTNNTAGIPTAPASGCQIMTTTVSKAASTYCNCAGGNIAGLNTYISKTSATTMCATSGATTPSGWVQVPDGGPSSPAWAKNATSQCSLNSLVVSASCWDALDLTDYVTWWWQNFNHTCDGLGFGDCFYAQMTTLAPSNCTQVGPSQPCKQPSFDDFSNQWNGARNFYVAWNIWNMGSFFSKYNAAIGLASTIASEGVGNITQVINPSKAKNVGLNTAMVVLSAGLALVTGPEDAPVAGMLLSSTQQIPGIARFMFPEGNNLANQMLDFDSVDASLGTLTQTLANSVAAGLPPLLNDPTNFLAAAKTGLWSAQQPDANGMENAMLPAFFTYITSQLFLANQVVVTRAPNTDVNELSTNGTKLEWKTNCGQGYGQYSECDTFFFDSTDKTTYALTDGRSYGESNNACQKTNYNSAMQTLFRSYTNGTNLLAGSYACAQAKGTNVGNQAPNITDLTKGPAGIECLASLPVCTWTMDNGDKGAGAFSDCNTTTLGSVFADDEKEVSVPIQYLGWGILNQNNNPPTSWSFSDTD